MLCHKNFLVCALTLAVIGVIPQVASAQTSVVPANKKALITAFSGDMFRGAITTVNNVANWFRARGYQVPGPLIRTAWNPANPPQETGNSGYFTIEDYENELVTGDYGVVFNDGHAGNAGVAVEHFEFDTQMALRYINLTTIFGYTGNDIKPFSLGNENTIAITAGFLRDKSVHLAQNAFVYINSCDSYRWFNSYGADRSNQNIPWLDGSVGGVVFLGNPGFCWPDNDDPALSSLFGEMLGVGRRPESCGNSRSPWMRS